MREMVEHKKKQAIQHILLVLREKSLSINELADTVGISWETTKNYLELLKELNVVIEFEQGNKRMFKVEKPTESNKDTLFNLPLEPKEEALCKSLFGFIKKRWHEKTGKYPGRTQMQKTVVEVADRTKLDIPRGWYILGEMCVLQYNENEDYAIGQGHITRDVEMTIDICIDELSPLSSDAIIQRQYEVKSKKLYLVKKTLNRVLLNNITSQEQEKQIGALLYSLVVNFPLREDNKEIVELLNIFVGSVNQIFVLKPVSEVEALRPEIQEIYLFLWELIASYNLFYSLTEERKKYAKEFALQYFKPRFDTLLQIARELLAHFAEHCKTEVEVGDYAELYKLKGSAKPNESSAEEKKKAFDEFEKTDTSGIFRKLSIN